MQRVATSGSCEPDRQGRPPGTGKLAPYTAFLIGKPGDSVAWTFSRTRDLSIG